MKKLIVLSLLSLLTACVQVPMTTITVPTARGTVTIKAPKDTDIEELNADFEKGKVSLGKYKARMNPDVVNASAAGQVEIMKQWNELADKLIAAGKAAGAGAVRSEQYRLITPDQLRAINNSTSQQVITNK